VSGFSNEFHDAEGGVQVKARLKWFNATKGFGFVSPLDGATDAFLHVSILHRAGLQELGDQAELMVEVGPGPKGPQVTRIVEILDHGQPASAPAPRAPDRGSDSYTRPGYESYDSQPSRPTGPEEEMSGVVKWFKADKGFGFITADGSGSDVFVHKSVLTKSGLYSLEAGQRVQMRVQEVQKGREATWIAAD
jgi:CspA family cold shock protein